MQKRNADLVVLSDIHLGTYGCHATELVNYLRSISPSILILNGDIIDGWQFNKYYFPPAHLQVIKEILNLLSQGTRVVYITGNHDELLRRYSGVQLHNFQLVDKIVMEINGKMTWIFHGDIFDNTTKGMAKFFAQLGGYGYKWLILSNRMVNWCLTKFNRPKISFSKKIKNSVKKAVKWISDFEETASELAIKKKFDCVICGHIHQPQKRWVQNKEGSVQYLNSGDWVENLTALEFINNDWQIYKYDPLEFTSAPVIPMNKKSPQQDVLTDEISLIINSLSNK